MSNTRKPSPDNFAVLGQSLDGLMCDFRDYDATLKAAVAEIGRGEIKPDNVHEVMSALVVIRRTSWNPGQRESARAIMDTFVSYGLASRP